jgi:SAM-dependent methyltransferase
MPMTLGTQSPRPGPTLREIVLQRYLSSSAGPHRRIGEPELQAYNRAYSWYLQGWLPAADNRRRWLDLGCGQGALMSVAKNFGYRDIEGVDESEEMLAVCRESGLRVQQCNVFDYLLRQTDGSWHVVSAFDFLEHFDKADGFRLLCEIRRVLTPDGVCLLKLPNADSPFGFSVTASDLTHEAVYSPCSLEQLGRLAGFSSCAFREVAPTRGSLRSIVRGILWRGVRLVFAALNTIETGAAGSGIYTRVMLARLSS